MFKRASLALLSQLYILVVKIRHFFFNAEFIKSRSFDLPVICVGNITVGGTGKTPMCELLLEHFLQQGGVALLSRGYGRKSHGYREVETTDSYREVGDEPLQMKQKYPEALVVVCEKRVDAVQRIIKKHPEVKVVVMDDGFQHRQIAPKINIIMVDHTRPFFEDSPLPLGSLRDTPKSLHHRADYCVVTKCPKGMTKLDMSLFRKEVQTMADSADILFTCIVNHAPKPLFEECAESVQFTKDQDVVMLAGVGNPKPFKEMIEREYHLVDSLVYPDHHSFNSGDIKSMLEMLMQHPSAVILTTEKDSVKLQRNNELPELLKSRIYYSPINMEFLSSSQSEFLKKIERDVRCK